MFERQEIAHGHNNAANLKPFPLVSPPLFRDYERAIPQEWRSYVGKQLTGRRLDKAWGKPSVILTFGSLSRDEFAWLQTYVGRVTVTVLNEDTHAWQTFNGTLREFTAADFTKAGNRYTDVRLEIIDLTEL